MMYAVEFETNIINGMIKVPPEYRDAMQEHVRVIVMIDERRSSSGNEKLISFLKQKPFVIQGFVPMKREDLYGSRK